MNRLAERLNESGLWMLTSMGSTCDQTAHTAIREYGECLRRIVLIGHSMGGRCVLMIARRLQEAKITVGLLVTVDPVHSSPSVPAM